MKPAFVADASVAVAWVHPAQATPETAAMLDTIADGATLEVPALWPLEVANALLVLARRGKLDEDERMIGLGWLQGLPVRIDADAATLAFSRLSELAESYQSIGLRRCLSGARAAEKAATGLQGWDAAQGCKTGGCPPLEQLIRNQQVIGRSLFACETRKYESSRFITT